MDRKEFIKTCGFACIGGGLLAGLIQGCTPSKMITAEIEGHDMIIPLEDFVSGDTKDKKYIVAKNKRLQYPVCVYRFSETSYLALLMRCTHKNVELQVFGDKLICPAHGSEFTNQGHVLNGPAESNLRILPLTINHNQLRISLK